MIPDTETDRSLIDLIFRRKRSLSWKVRRLASRTLRY